jgi:N-acetylglucosaminyldiphosphoundecaprenol N-acetyl-beta-D-mannosaminyltransferase
MARGVLPEVTTVELFGTRFHCLTLQQTCDAAEAMIRARDRCYLICVKDVGLTMRSRQDQFLSRFYQGADLLVADGRGLELASWLLGRPLVSPGGGPEIYEEMLLRAAAHGYGVYLLGAKLDAVTEAARRLRARMPPVRVVGYHHGYFVGHQEVVTDILRTRPDIVFVGMSTPAREVFLDRWREFRSPCLCIPIGGVIDIEAGLVRRAPRWMNRSGLEWLFRVLQEPRRLFRRYARTHTLFAMLLALALLRRALSAKEEPR